MATSENRRRTWLLAVRLFPSEFDHWRLVAARRGISAAELVRRAVAKEVNSEEALRTLNRYATTRREMHPAELPACSVCGMPCQGGGTPHPTRDGDWLCRNERACTQAHTLARSRTGPGNTRRGRSREA